jgi:hypothetical protein
MTKTTMMKSIAAGFLLAAMFAGVSSAQISDSPERSRYLNTGLFTVAEGEGVNFHVALDDRRTGAPATVLMRLFNQDGAVVARHDIILQAGQSTTLRINQPGLYRAHAEVRDSSSSACERRTVRGTVEIFRPLSPTPPPPEDTIASIILRMLLAHDDGRSSTCPQ